MNKESFVSGDTVVYPGHGVGLIKAVESQIIAGHSLDVYVIAFDNERMTLRLPVAKAHSSGLRHLCSHRDVEKILEILACSPKTYKVAWSKKMTEFEGKVNSGCPKQIAEVIRDLHRCTSQQDPSYTEKQLYRNALERLIKEVSMVEDLDETAAQHLLESRMPRDVA